MTLLLILRSVTRNRGYFGMFLTVRKNSIMSQSASNMNSRWKWTGEGGISIEIPNDGGRTTTLNKEKSGFKRRLKTATQRYFSQ